MQNKNNWTGINHSMKLKAKMEMSERKMKENTYRETQKHKTAEQYKITVR